MNGSKTKLRWNRERLAFLGGYVMATAVTILIFWVMELL